MKRLVLAFVLGLILVLIAAPAVLAGPPSPPDYGKYNPIDLENQPPEEWGVEKVKPPFSAPGGTVRIITDPLEGVGDGWVTFWCQSQIGFQYNIGATGLETLSRYSVHALGIQAHIVPPGTPGAIYVPDEGFWIIIDDPSLDLDLGTLQTDANGLGGVKGVKRLASGYLYILGTVVYSESGPPVLWSPADDPNAFMVY